MSAKVNPVVVPDKNLPAKLLTPSYWIILFLNFKLYKLEPTSKKLTTSQGVQADTDEVIAEKYIIPSAVFTIGSPTKVLAGNG